MTEQGERPPRESSGTSTIGASILLMDGLESYRARVASALRELGFEVVEAGGAEQAEKAARVESFAAAVIDGCSRSREARGLVRRLRETAPRTRIALVVSPEQEAGEDARGAVRLMRGPLHPGALARETVRMLEASAPDVVSRPPKPPRRSSATEGSLAESRLRDIRRQYGQRLPSEIDELVRCCREAREAEDGTEALRGIKRLAHTIHGTAGTMGFEEVSEATARIESIAARCLGGEEPTDEHWRGIDAELERARTAPGRISLASESPVRASEVATVLVVDDDPEILASVELLARRNLVRAISAENPEQALLRAGENELDGAIIDINLGPGVDPSRTAQDLRSSEGNEQLPIAFMSVDGSVPNRVAAAAAGATQFLKKPLSAGEFVEAVQIFSSRRRQTSWRVLIVDDDPAFAAHIAAILEADGMRVAVLDEPERALETLDRERPDLMLLDVVMPEICGFDVCRMVRSTASWRRLPILFLTAEQSAAVRVECFRAGGDDYIQKPVVREELLARIGVRIERLRMFRERADRDALTGLANRRSFLESFRLRLADSSRHGRPLSLGLMDLDHFKRINDTHGHLAGDRVLAAFGKLLASRFRETDIRGRWGGEEFTVAFYGEDGETARMILGRLLDELREMSFTGDDGESFRVTFSAGVATYPDDGSAFDELLRTADERLYRAKDAGRAGVV